MAGICLPNPTLRFKRIHGIRCCSGNENSNRIETTKNNKTPQFLKLSVSGVTELLRLFSFSTKDRVSYDKERNEKSVSSVESVDDVLMILKDDYENSYFVSGIFTFDIYDEDCIFEDPTIRFQGTELYSRNLKLLVPFFESPYIGLENIEKGVNSDTNYLQAKWKLRTYLKFPWRPFISIDGRTVYELNNKLKIVRHVESWNISALEAIGQIFTPSSWRPGN